MRGWNECRVCGITTRDNLAGWAEDDLCSDCAEFEWLDNYDEMDDDDEEQS